MLDTKHFFILLSLLAVSVAFLLTPVVRGLATAIRKQRKLDSADKKSTNRVLFFSACLLGSIWCLRYAVGCFEIILMETVKQADPSLQQIGLNWGEEFLNSVVHALQTFSMDEEYTEYILNGKQMIRHLIGSESGWEDVYGFYASVLNVVAPVAGGAIILDILAGVLPGVKLWFYDLVFWRDKYFFSELNEESLALAKSVADVKELKNPVVIFTDAYVDDETEKDSELYLEAKRIGAICVRDDLVHVRKNRLGKRKFFLIDQTEMGNLHALVEMTNSRNYRYLKKTEVFLFTNDDAYVQVESRMRDKLHNQWNFGKDDMPVVVPVKSYGNLISNLLGKTVPLYEPLIGKKPNGDGQQNMTVTILGTGHIGVEMFLTTYWIGQMLDCQLRINVLSQETEDEFWNRIDYINPEIRQSTIPGHPVLRYNHTGGESQPYCQVEYVQCDVKSSRFVECLTWNPQIMNTDYFLVALGSDEVNISVANAVRRYIGQYHLAAGAGMKTVIAYVVYRPELADLLNQKKLFRADNRTPDIYMLAVGNLRDVYSYENVFMRKYNPYVEASQKAYDTAVDNQNRTNVHQKRAEDEYRDYKYWADLARVLHIQYKVFSMGLIKKSLFDPGVTEESYREATAEACKEAWKIVTGETGVQDEQEKLIDRLAWLEHRRWNAFTRVKGFRSTDAYRKYTLKGDDGSYKQMELKLHPCLVECALKGTEAAPDLLDELTAYLNKAYNGNRDFKYYDYPVESLLVQGLVPEITQPDKKAAEQQMEAKKNNGYTPAPVDTSGIELPESLLELTERIAENVHENWSQGRIDDGWVYGTERDDDKKTTPCLVPYDQLTEEEKAFDRLTALETLKTIIALGYGIRRRKK